MKLGGRLHLCCQQVNQSHPAIETFLGVGNRAEHFQQLWIIVCFAPQVDNLQRFVVIHLGLKSPRMLMKFLRLRRLIRCSQHFANVSTLWLNLQKTFFGQCCQILDRILWQYCVADNLHKVLTKTLPVHIFTVASHRISLCSSNSKRINK